jgi:hypothetical protein
VAGDVRLALRGAFEVAAPAVVAPSEADSPRRVWQRPLPALSVVVLAVAIGALAAWGLNRQVVEPPNLMRFVIRPPEGAPLTLGGPQHDLAVSRAGTSIAYGGWTAGMDDPQVNLHSLDQVGGIPLRSSEGGLGPFFSPDGEWVGFVDYRRGTSIRKVSVFGGPPVTLTDSPATVMGATWGSDDYIVFGTVSSGLFG